MGWLVGRGWQFVPVTLTLSKNFKSERSSTSSCVKKRLGPVYGYVKQKVGYLMVLRNSCPTH